MKLAELQKQITSKTLDKLYIFVGDEIAVMNIYLNKMYTDLGVVPSVVNSIQDAYSKLAQKRIYGSSRCFVVRDDKEFLKQEKLWARVFGQVRGGSDYLIIIYSSLDKRSKFYKSQSANMVEFEKLSVEILTKYVQKEISMTDALARQLIEICEQNYNRILLECDKINRYYSARSSEFKTGYDGVFLRLKNDGTIHQPIGDITFKFTDAILMRDYKSTADYLLQAKQKQEPEMMVLSILYNSFKQILMVQGLGPNPTEITKRTGLTPWQVKLAQEKKGHYSIPELIDAIKTVRFAEKGIKTGQLDADIALEYVICKIM